MLVVVAVAIVGAAVVLKFVVVVIVGSLISSLICGTAINRFDGIVSVLSKHPEVCSTIRAV